MTARLKSGDKWMNDPHLNLPVFYSAVKAVRLSKSKDAHDRKSPYTLIQQFAKRLLKAIYIFFSSPFYNQEMNCNKLEFLKFTYITLI